MRVPLVALIMTIGSCCFGQKSVEIALQDRSLESAWNYDTLYKVKVVVTNHSSTNIKVPLEPSSIGKEIMSTREIGMEIKNKGEKVKTNHQVLIQYINPPAMQELKPGSSEMVEINIPGNYFPRKGKYKLKFFLRNPNNRKGKKNLYFDSDVMTLNLT